MPRRTKQIAEETAAELAALTPEQQDERLLARAKTDEGVPTWQIRAALGRMKNPPRTNLNHLVEDSLYHFLCKEDRVKRECMRRETDAVRRQAAGENPSPLEALLAERVAVCWLQVQIAEALQACTLAAGNVRTDLPQQKRVEMAQRRYLAAVKALAQVRRLQLPAVQVNIGQTQNIAESQVNVAGTPHTLRPGTPGIDSRASRAE